MEVSYVDHMGTDLSVVNAARVSFGKRSDSLTERDKGLIRFLARGCTKKDWNQIVEGALDCGGGRETLFRQHPSRLRSSWPVSLGSTKWGWCGTR